MKLTPSFRQRQQGVALIVTLIMLVVITLMGVVAMRSGLLQVAMSTNSQVTGLLFQNSDAGVNAVYNQIMATDASSDPNNPVNLAKSYPGQELTNCLTTTGLSSTATVPSPVRCTATSTISGRGAVLVQTALKVPTDSSGNPQMVVSYGTDASVLPGGGGVLIAAYSTSVMPAFGSATASQITSCLSSNPQDAPSGTTTITDCLTNVGASFTTSVQEFASGYAGYKQ